MDFIRKIVKSRSKSPSKQQQQTLQQNHIDDKLGDDLVEKWNPTMGRFKSSTKKQQKDDGGLAKPSGYLMPDGIVSDGQLPSSSAQTAEQLMDADYHHLTYGSAHTPYQTQQKEKRYIPKGGNQRSFGGGGGRGTAASAHFGPHSPTPASTMFEFGGAGGEGYFSSVSSPLMSDRPILRQSSTAPKTPRTISESESNQTLFHKDHNERQRNDKNAWIGSSNLLFRTSQSNPESSSQAESRFSSKQSSLRSPPQRFASTKDPFFGVNEEDLSPTPTIPNHLPQQFRTRSISPKKTVKPLSEAEDKSRPYRSRSPTKGSRSGTAYKAYDYLHSQCKLEGCSAILIVEDARFFVCKHQLSHASEFFRTLFIDNRALPLEGVQKLAPNEYSLTVSNLRHPPQSTQFQWFLESVIPLPVLRDITEESLETCMRLSKRFQARGLELRCAKFIQENVEHKSPIMALCWLNWAFKHRFERSVRERCLPVVARLSLHQLERHRQMMPESVYSDLLAVKLRATYQQSANVFRSIHKMDHFFVDLDRCPRCGRTREQGKVRVQANPCHKLVGCERCMKEFGCEIDDQREDFQAYYVCDHGVWAFNELTEDCKCQTSLYKTALSGGGTYAAHPHQPPKQLSEKTSGNTSSSTLHHPKSTTMERQRHQQQQQPSMSGGGGGTTPLMESKASTQQQQQHQNQNQQQPLHRRSSGGGFTALGGSHFHQGSFSPLNHHRFDTISESKEPF